ncbi:MAG: ABC transporter ATP-binding protein/permease [Coriobacteriales bacterium]|jgi:ATP-binding cassette subfamily B protein|nr:ABC transporter ATP-binding protein/permease [Coriobacteriales bacterium]
MKDYLRVLGYAGENRHYFTRAVLLLTASVLFSVAPFFIISLALSAFFGPQPPSLPWLFGMVAAIFACLLLKNLLNGLGLDASHKLAYYTLAGMRRRVAAKLLKMSMGEVQSFGTAAAKKNFVENIEEMELILAHGMPEGLANLFTFVIVLITMLVVDWRMGLAGLATIIIGMVPVMLMMSDGLKRMKPWYAANERMTATIIEYISGMEVIKVFGQQGRSFARYREAVDDYRDETLSWYKAAFLHMTSYTVLLTSALLLMLPLGIWLYLGGTLSVSTLVLSLLLGMAIGIPAMRLISFLPLFPQLGYKAARIEGMFAIPDMPQGTSPAPAAHDLVLEEVSFAYGEQDVVSEVSLELPENTVTALVGESGSGKSTLARLMMRFWDVRQGAVLLGGTDIRDIPTEALMDKVSYVAQENFLFNVSLMENIRYGRPEASDEEVIEVARAAQCHEFISEMDEGYDTVVGSAGDKLSGGQKQRICIARALLQDAPVIILDEATSFADPENEDRIQEALSKLIAGKTVVIVAHRLSTIMQADNIVVLAEGRVADQGKHEELLGRCALYQRLWKAHKASMDWDIGGGSDV